MHSVNERSLKTRKVVFISLGGSVGNKLDVMGALRDCRAVKFDS